LACLLELGVLLLQAAALLLKLEALLLVSVKAEHSRQRHLLNGLCQKVPERCFYQLCPFLLEACL